MSEAIKSEIINNVIVAMSYYISVERDPGSVGAYYIQRACEGKCSGYYHYAGNMAE